MDSKGNKDEKKMENSREGIRHAQNGRVRPAEETEEIENNKNREQPKKKI